MVRKKRTFKEASWDILRYISNIEDFMQEVRVNSADELEQNKMLLYAVTYAVGAIGEATKEYIPDSVKEAINVERVANDEEEIEWKKIAGIRDRLFHAWDIASRRVKSGAWI